MNNVRFSDHRSAKVRIKTRDIRNSEKNRSCLEAPLSVYSIGPPGETILFIPNAFTMTQHDDVIHLIILAILEYFLACRLMEMHSVFRAEGLLCMRFKLMHVKVAEDLLETKELNSRYANFGMSVTTP